METSSKLFRKRNAILECLQRSTEHPSAEALYERLCQNCSDISRASVYRNLAHFKEQGLVVSLGTVNGIERFDGRIDPHVHFCCSRCGAICDVPDLPIPEEIGKAAALNLGCRVDGAQLVLSGVCKNCQ